MSGGSQKQLKQFSINTIQDACAVLQTLISAVYINLEKYKEYAAEAISLLENIDSEYVDAKKYDDINDKLLYRQHELFKYVADYQNTSFSYIQFRPILEKKGYLKAKLSEDISKTLSELLDVRNWSFHNTQSRMVAAKEAAEKGIPDFLKEYVSITTQLNPVIIRKVTQYEILMLATLTMHNDERISQFEQILEKMKEDYQELFDSIENKPLMMSPSVGLSTTVQYVEINGTSSISDYHSDIAQVSMAIQKSKYDGTNEKFNEWAIRPKIEKAENKTAIEVENDDYHP